VWHGAIPIVTFAIVGAQLRDRLLPRGALDDAAKRYMPKQLSSDSALEDTHRHNVGEPGDGTDQRPWVAGAPCSEVDDGAAEAEDDRDQAQPLLSPECQSGVAARHLRVG
jgi:hypothetical protein